jgi:tetratricopeptide (TPR) repeat protein
VYDDAERQLAQAIDALRAHESGHQESLASALSVLAHVQSSTQRFDHAWSSIDEAETLVDQASESRSGSILRAQLAHQRGIILHDRGEFRESMEHYERAIGFIEHDESAAARRIVAQSLIGLGVDAKRLEMFDEALSYYEQAAAILREHRSSDHPDALAVEGNRAEILSDLGRSDEAITILRELLERRRSVFGESHERVGITMNNLADLLREKGELNEAASLQARAIGIFRVNPGDPSMRLAIALHNAAALRLTQNNPEEAYTLLLESIEQASSLLPESHWIPSSFRVKLAECLLALGRDEDARSEAERARVVLVAALGASHSRVEQADRVLREIAEQTDAGAGAGRGGAIED